jgi:transcriptional regulator with XRE-family HTH domain
MQQMGPLSIRDVGDYIREQRRAAQVSLRQLARLAGVSNPYLSQIERGLRKPSAEILQQIAKGLRISAEQLYIQAGILDERLGDTEVVAAILADAALTERQKQVLLEIYESFRKENAGRAGPAGDADPDSGPDSDTGSDTGSGPALASGLAADLAVGAETDGVGAAPEPGRPTPLRPVESVHPVEPIAAPADASEPGGEPTRSAS